jgi:hypothetical protein
MHVHVGRLASWAICPVAPSPPSRFNAHGYPTHSHDDPTQPELVQVAVVGASGGIGQPLSMLLKLDKGVTDLSLYDIVHTPGVAADLSHIPTKGKVVGHKGESVGNW